MSQILVRFLLGGAVVSAFAIIGDLLKPKSFAGLFGAAPSVALATLGLTVATEGASSCRHRSPLHDGRCNRIHGLCLLCQLGHDAFTS